jgi:Ca-activated chloride channel homolog
MRNWLLHISLLFLTLTAFGQKGNDLIKEGNKLYEKGDFSEAEVRYRKAEAEKGDPFVSRFNLGTSLFRQERFEEAASAFQQFHPPPRTRSRRPQPTTTWAIR